MEDEVPSDNGAAGTPDMGMSGGNPPPAAPLDNSGANAGDADANYAPWLENGQQPVPPQPAPQQGQQPAPQGQQPAPQPNQQPAPQPVDYNAVFFNVDGTPTHGFDLGSYQPEQGKSPVLDVLTKTATDLNMSADDAKVMYTNLMSMYSEGLQSVTPADSELVKSNEASISSYLNKGIISQEEYDEITLYPQTALAASALSKMLQAGSQPGASPLSPGPQGGVQTQLDEYHKWQAYLDSNVNDREEYAKAYAAGMKNPAFVKFYEEGK